MTQQRVSPITVTSLLPATPVLSLQAALGQSANLTEWKNSSGSVLASVNSSGAIASSVGISNAANTGAYLDTTTNAMAIIQRTNTTTLIVRGAASQTADLQQWQNSAATVFGIITSAGRLAIGSSTTVTTFQGAIPGIQANGTATSDSALMAARFSADTGGANIYLHKSRSGTIGTQSALSSGDRIGNIYFAGSDGTNSLNAATVLAEVDGAVSTGIVPGRLVFFTQNTSGTATDRMRIDSSGNVVIGSNAAKTRLQITGSSTSNPIPTLGTASGSVYITNSDTNYGLLIGTINTGATWFQTQRTDGTAASYDLLFQPSGGNVGIGKTPSVLLDVAGAIASSGKISSSSATAGIGYGTGAGGTVTQATDKTTGVTLSKVTGQITMNNAALAADTTVSFVLTNTAVAATDVVHIQHISGGTLGAYTCTAAPGAGSATIYVRNVTAGSLSEAIVLQFVVIKAVTA